MGNLSLILFSLVVCGAVLAQNVLPPFGNKNDSGDAVIGNLKGVGKLERKNENSCTCGMKGQRRIRGGTVASKHEYPWMAAICHGRPCDKYTFKCGGSVINDQFVLTAAHCVHRYILKYVFVTLGDHTLSIANETGSQRYTVNKTIVHKGYEERTLKNDIALVKLDRKIQMSESVMPVCLPGHHKSYVGRKVLLSGWGSSIYGGPVEDVLKETTELTVISRKECLETFKRFSPNFTMGKVICTKSHHTSGCPGDSGGPLIYKSRTGSYQQIGIVTGGWNCTNSTFPAAYIKVDQYLDFIKRNTRKSKYCKNSFPN